MFNEAGCQLYQNGRGQEAYELFSGAIQALHYSCGAWQQEMDPLSSRLLFMDPSVQCALHRMNACGAVVPTENWCSCDDPRGNASPIIFSRKVGAKEDNAKQPSPSLDSPFLLNEVFSMEGLNEIPCGSLMHYAIAISIVLYNEALVLHRGEVTNSCRSLERALTLYGMAGRTLLENCVGGFIQRHPLASMLCCGILNNMAFVLHQMGDFDASGQCFERLSEFLSTLPPSATVEEKHHREEFTLNFTLFYRSLPSAAAA